MTQRLQSFSTSRPVAVLMVFLAAIVFGTLSYRRLPVTLMPELTYPTLTVRTEYPGAAPEEVENDVSRRIEAELGVVSGLQRMSSISRAGVSDVVLEFSWDSDMSDALQATLEKLDLVFLPEQAERPLILRFDPNLDPVMEISLSGEGERFEGDEGLRRLRRLAELQVKKALEPIRGVAAVRVRGGLEEQIRVQLDADAMQRSGLSIQTVIDRLQSENINVAGGTLKEGRTEYMVRTLNEYQSLDEIRETVISIVDGREIRVADVGEVVFGHRDREILTRTRGRNSVQLDLFKEGDANMVVMATAVRERMGELDLEEERLRARGEYEPPPPRGVLQRWPPWRRDQGRKAGLAQEMFRNEGVVVQVVADRSEFIEASILEVRNTAVLGGLLAVVVLYLFLRNLATTLIVAVSIPISLLIGFAPLNLLGVSLNIMSLGGLALGVGMLVDSSIVALESIFRCREEGDDLQTAAVRGVREVRAAIIASTLTSIAVFFPMVFVEGVAGQAFGDLGLAVVISLLISMVVALSFVPMLASRRGWNVPLREGFLDRLRKPASWLRFQSDREHLRRWRMEEGARRSVASALATLGLGIRLVVSLVLEIAAKLVLALVLGVVALLARLVAPILGRGFRFLVRGPLEVMNLLLRAVSRAYPRLLRWSLDWPLAVAVVIAATLGASWWMLQGLETELLPEVRQGEFTFEVSLPVGTPLEETVRILESVERAILEERRHVQSVLVTYGYDVANAQSSDEGEHTARFKLLLESVSAEVEDDLVRRLRARFSSLPDVSARVTRPVLFSFRTPIEVEIHGEDLGRLKDLAAVVEQRMQQMPELADVEATLQSGAPEVRIVYDRDLLARYDLSTSAVARMVRDQVQGFEATLFNLRDRRVPIVVLLEEEDRRSISRLSELVVNPGSERPILLGSIADLVLGEGPSEVRRVDRRRVAVLRANLGDAPLGAAVAALEVVLAEDIDWPADMGFEITGQSREWERSKNSLWLALGLSIFLVYVIMAAQFESLLHPLVIMFTIPLALFGTVLTLFVLDVNLSIVVFLGMIMLAGIVVNNAIVLVDYINTLKARGLGRREAILTAGSVRLRPILMTTATTTLGLAPMALGFGEGAEIRTPMALAVIGGLVASTGLTLVVIPVVYQFVDILQARILGRRETSDDGAERFPEGDAA